MRANQSSTASGMYSRSGTRTAPIPILAEWSTLPTPESAAAQPPSRRKYRPHLAQENAGVAQRQGLLHDARNLTSAIGLYCDLLSQPGVLKPEHREYADDLRLLGTRSGTLIDRLMLSLCEYEEGSQSTRTGEARERRGTIPAQPPKTDLPPVSLREIVEHCSGLLSRVAGGRAIDLTFGPAASVPVRIDEEAVERILVNLVRNASVALDARLAASRPTVRTAASQPPQTIRIGVGLLYNRIGDPAPWPFRRVRLAVEDSGCGMTADQLEHIMQPTRPASNASHGIGFRVVRDLVTASAGEVRVISLPGIGTRVQIEWPIEPSIAKAAGERTRASNVPQPTSRRIRNNDGRATA
jgi:signal transduction histidine kinase